MAMPALRNLGRLIGRQAKRLRLVLERRKLARLETSLGLLGWQQADYDSGTQQQVDRLNAYEREQARLTNESADLGLKIVEIDEQRGALACEYSEAQAATLKKEYPSAATLEELETQLATKRKECREAEGRLSTIDRELSEAEEKYRSLVVPEMPPPQLQAQLQHWRKVILAHPQEKADRTAKLREVTSEAAAMEALLKTLIEARTQFEKRDQELDDEVGTLQRAKRKVEKQVEVLEKSKSDPYREIGRALGDQKIKPLNQPEALTAVLDQREKIAAIERAIAASLLASGMESRSVPLKVWIAIGGMMGVETAALLAIGGQ